MPRRGALAAAALILAFVISPARGTTAGEVVFEFLPGRRIFPPVVADPNEPKLAAESFWAQRGSLEGFAFHIGAIAPLVEFQAREGKKSGGSIPVLQLNVDAGTLPILSRQAGFDLQAVDFQVGLPIDYRQGSFALRLRLGHVSSHLGDDFIRRRPDFPRESFSRDSLTSLASYELGRARVYGGGLYVLDPEPDVARETAQWGLELSGPAFWRERLATYLASDFQAKAENDYEVNVNVQAGIMTLGEAGRNVRIAFASSTGTRPSDSSSGKGCAGSGPESSTSRRSGCPEAVQPYSGKARSTWQPPPRSHRRGAKS